MTTSSRPTRAITSVVVGLLALALTSCGGARDSLSDGSATPTASPPATSSPTPSKTTEPTDTPTDPVIANGAIVFTQSLPLGDGQQTTIRAIDPDGTDLRTILAGAWQPTWSPDGTQIAYSDYPGGVTQIFVMNADGTGVRQVTDLPHGAEHPAWSPDGTRIAYVAYDPDVLTSIWTVRAVDGQDPHQVVPATYDDDNPTMAWEPAWGPDGRIAFSALDWTTGGEPEDAIFTARSDGTGMTRVTPGSGAFTPDWSPDGRWLAFQRHHDGTVTLHLIGADGTDERQLVQAEHGVFSPAWSPDGTQIVFVKAGTDDGRPTQALWIVDTDGTDLHQLHDEGDAPSWQRLTEP